MLNMTVREWVNVPKRTEYNWFSEAVSYNRFGTEIKGSERPITADEEVKQFRRFREAVEFLNREPDKRARLTYPEMVAMASVSSTLSGAFFMLRFILGHNPIDLGISLVSFGLAIPLIRAHLREISRGLDDVSEIWAKGFSEDITNYYLERRIPDEFFAVDPEMAEHLSDEVSLIREHFQENPECEECFKGPQSDNS